MNNLILYIDRGFVYLSRTIYFSLMQSYKKNLVKLIHCMGKYIQIDQGGISNNLSVVNSRILGPCNMMNKGRGRSYLGEKP